MQKKHAYLIMAHNKFDMLCHLLTVLDDERNDIYLHIDLKTKNIPYDDIKKSVEKSSLTFVRRINVIWGDYAQVECEMELLKTAVANGNYGYLHLISGLDLPIKSQDEIHDFFDLHNGKEFFDIEVQENDRYIRSRCRYYWLFQHYIGRHSKKSLFRLLEGINVRIQRTLKVNRIPKQIEIKKGANWFSITGNLAEYIVSLEKVIKKHFKYTFCADEVFLQTIVYNSDFKSNLYKPQDNEPASRRLIDWNRGNPYVFRIEDIDMIKNSNCLFARKFDNEFDRNIINEIDKITQAGNV